MDDNRRIDSISDMINQMQIYKMKNAFCRPNILDLKHELETLDISTNTHIHTTSHTVPLNNKQLHKRLGLITQPHPDTNDSIELVEFQVGTTTHQYIQSWKQRLNGTITISVNNESITNDDDIEIAIQNAWNNNQKNITIVFGSLVGFVMSGEGVPTLQADQLNVIVHNLNAITTSEDLWPEENDWPTLIDSPEILPIQLKIKKLQWKMMKETPEWESFLKSEHKQLNRYETAGMFGELVRMEDWMTVLPWVWTYLYKEDPVTVLEMGKARGTCNGGPQYGVAVTLAETYTACVEQPIHCLTWAISAALNLYCKGYDVGNAFAEALAPVDPFFMYPDDQYNEWWLILGNNPIPNGYVIPILKGLQRYLESPRLWDKQISIMLTHKLGFKPTVHTPYLYYKCDSNGDITLILRQVNDFLVANKSNKECDKIEKQIQDHMIKLLNKLGTIRKFNGVNIDQKRDFNHVHCETYIDKTVQHHGWQNEKTRKRPIPMKMDVDFQIRIQLEEGPESMKERKHLERQMGFNYQQCIGELVYTLTICCVDISIAVTTLSQHAINPAKIHYEAVKQVFLYLNATKKVGLTYWRIK